MEINGNQLKLLDPNIETRREREIEKYGKSFRKVGANLWVKDMP
jgi:hypothetical protein